MAGCFIKTETNEAFLMAHLALDSSNNNSLKDLTHKDVYNAQKPKYMFKASVRKS